MAPVSILIWLIAPFRYALRPLRNRYARCTWLFGCSGLGTLTAHNKWINEPQQFAKTFSYVLVAAFSQLQMPSIASSDSQGATELKTNKRHMAWVQFFFPVGAPISSSWCRCRCVGIVLLLSSGVRRWRVGNISSFGCCWVYYFQSNRRSLELEEDFSRCVTDRREGKKGAVLSIGKSTRCVLNSLWSKISKVFFREGIASCELDSLMYQGCNARLLFLWVDS